MIPICVAHIVGPILHSISALLIWTALNPHFYLNSE